MILQDRVYINSGHPQSMYHLGMKFWYFELYQDNKNQLDMKCKSYLSQQSRFHFDSHTYLESVQSYISSQVDRQSR